MRVPCARFVVEYLRKQAIGVGCACWVFLEGVVLDDGPRGHSFTWWRCCP